METEGSEPRAKRQKKDKFGRNAALERLKGLKGSKHKYEVSQVDDIFDTVDEKEYTNRVLARQDDDWIVDEEGCSGYVEDGRDIFDDDYDQESISAAAQNKSTGKKKKKNVSENAGRGKLHVMLSNMPSKKKEDVKLGEDDILSELISEIDDSDGKTNYSTPRTSAILKPKPIPSFSLSADKKAARDYMKSFSAVTPKQKEAKAKTPEPAEEENQENEDGVASPPPTKVEKPSMKILREIQQKQLELNASKKRPIEDDSNAMTPDEKAPLSQRIEEFATQEDMLDDDFDMTGIEEFDSYSEPGVGSEDAKGEVITEEQLLEGWSTMQAGTSNESNIDIKVDISQLPTVTNSEGKKVFRFFWWDAFEDKYKQPGVVFLFGKTYCESAKTYVSCSVAVRNMDRKLYLLPRPYYLDNDGKPTDKAVALIDVYHEFNNDFAAELAIKSFRSKKVTKNYCFDPTIPVQSEYLEIRYSAKNRPLDREHCRDGGKSFSRVFGANTSFLELLLLDCKVKGPCWLDIASPEPVTNPITWCKFEVNCNGTSDLSIVQSAKPLPPPPLVIAAINTRTAVKNMSNEIVMMSCLVHTKYGVDKKPPEPMFEQHFCVFTRPSGQILPFDIHDALSRFKATKVQKMDSERALLNYFARQFDMIDPDLIVGHDLQGYQINVLSDRLIANKINQFSKFGKVKRVVIPTKHQLENQLLVGRLVCDMKISARELIKSRSFDLDTLCQTVLKLKEGQRVEIEQEEVPKMYQTSSDILKLVTLTMQDTAYILKMMFELNVIPLALQITNIAGNVMSRTLMGGRSERNEYLLLHAFAEKDYIVPDKQSKAEKLEDGEEDKRAKGGKKKPTYSGGLVLDPKVGFYDKFILLMDFNSLYPSIIQEYNICFTTIPASGDDEIVLPDQSLPPGILPTEIRKLVESRRGVKKLMGNPSIAPDLRIQYHIRQMALKLTANSMYGCLGFSHSRFFAKNLAALVTHKGREILTNTKDLVQKLSFEVIYGDTDSIMINTHSVEYDQVMKIGGRIKQEVNRLYRQVELEIDGVFKYLLLLKKKKYAAVTLTKGKSGGLKEEQEHKGLDIVRRDWSQLAAEAGKFILNHILSDQSSEDRIENIHSHLGKLKDDLEQGKVPVSLLVITKQLTKDPRMYADKNQLPHVQVALRYNKKGGKLLRAGDTVPYIICNDGTNSSATQRAYHVDELKNSETLKIDTKYYLAQQIHPVVTRLCDPIEGTDSFQIASCLGLDTSSFKKPQQQHAKAVGESLKKKDAKFRSAAPFVFKCLSCNTENKITDVPIRDRLSLLTKCSNPDCKVQPIDHLSSLQNQLTLKMREYIGKYYSAQLTCEDPACTNETYRMPLRFAGKYPICTLCGKGVMYKMYNETDLYNQLSYFQHIFDLSTSSRNETKIQIDSNVEAAFHSLCETAEKYLKSSSYSMINLSNLFSGFLIETKAAARPEIDTEDYIQFDSDDDVDEGEY